MAYGCRNEPQNSLPKRLNHGAIFDTCEVLTLNGIWRQYVTRNRQGILALANMISSLATVFVISSLCPRRWRERTRCHCHGGADMGVPGVLSDGASRPHVSEQPRTDHDGRAIQPQRMRRYAYSECVFRLKLKVTAELVYKLLAALPRSRLASIQRHITPLLQFDVLSVRMQSYFVSKRSYTLSIVSSNRTCPSRPRVSFLPVYPDLLSRLSAMEDAHG